jgi:hypothetical protein
LGKVRLLEDRSWAGFETTWSFGEASGEPFGSSVGKGPPSPGGCPRGGRLFCVDVRGYLMEVYPCPICGCAVNRMGKPFADPNQAVRHITGSHDADHGDEQGEDYHDKIVSNKRELKEEDQTSRAGEVVAVPTKFTETVEETSGAGGLTTGEDCPNCGEPLGASEPAIKRYIEKNGEAYCDECGAEIEVVE